MQANRPLLSVLRYGRALGPRAGLGRGRQPARSIQTRSNLEVRSPINSKSIRGWKKYKDMLKPAIEIFTQTDKYKNITS